MTVIDIRRDDPTASPARDLVTAHLREMSGFSPPESVHALGVAALAAPEVLFWSAYDEDRLAGVGALKLLDPGRGEIKSMRVADAFRGTGIGRRILRHIVAEARSLGLGSLWLETGSTPEFLPAQRLYLSEGFERCAPFGDYREDPYSIFMTRTL